MGKISKSGEQVLPYIPLYKKKEKKQLRTKEERELVIQKFEKLKRKNKQIINQMVSFGINNQKLEEIANSEDLTISELRYYLRLLLKSKREREQKKQVFISKLY